MIDVGMRLKSEEMIEFLEIHDLPVHYHFDRLHEGESDSYTVESEDPSLDLRFDADQRCTAIFIRDPGVALARRLVAFPMLTSPAEIEAYAKANSLTLVKGRMGSIDEPTHEALRLLSAENDRTIQLYIRECEKKPRIPSLNTAV